MKFLFLFMIFFSYSIFLEAAPALPIKYDTSKVKLRMPVASEVTKIKQDKEFNYKLAPTPDESFFSWVRYKISKILEVLFSDSGPIAFIRWTILILFLVFIILKILKIRPQSLFYKQRITHSITTGEFTEDIASLDFEKIISEAAEEGNYKKAVRFMYLKLLKILSEQNYILWSVYKSNHDYQKEMSITIHHTNFQKLSTLFEFTWYGNFTLNPVLFNKIKSEFAEEYQDLERIEQ